MPRGQYDRSPEAAEARRQARKMAGLPTPAKAINVDAHPDAKHGAATHVENVPRFKVEVLPPTLYVKVELPDLHGDTIEDHLEWLTEVKGTLAERGYVREFVVTGMPDTMHLIN